MKTTLKIEGMSCEHCVEAVKRALLEVKGVRSVEVSLAEEKAVVDHETYNDLLLIAVTEEGYHAEVR